MVPNRRAFLFTGVALALAVASQLFLSPSQAIAKSPSNVTKIEGTLVAKNVATRLLRIRRQGGVIVNVTVPLTAKVERNDLKATIAAFKAGDFVQVRSTGGVVTKAEAVGP